MATKKNASAQYQVPNISKKSAEDRNTVMTTCTEKSLKNPKNPFQFIAKLPFHRPLFLQVEP